jgi:hypothetical protein
MAMMANTNEGTLQRTVEALVRANTDNIGGIVDNEIVWHMPGRNLLTGDYRGRDEVLGLFKRMQAMTNDTFNLEYHEVLANEEHGVILSMARGERNGRLLGIRRTSGYRVGVIVCHFMKGKVSECWYYPPDQGFEDKFWS